jgi:hypothetical protein
LRRWWTGDSGDYRKVVEENLIQMIKPSLTLFVYLS